MDQTGAVPEALRQDPKTARLLNSPEALKQLLSAPETRQLMDLLNRQAGSDLQNAAQAAAKGRPEALMGLLERVTCSPEGAATVEGLRKKAAR